MSFNADILEICGTCKYHKNESVDNGWVCVNPESEYCTDWTEYDDWCIKFSQTNSVPKKRQYSTPPVGAIPCCEADPITGHHPHWVKCDEDNPSDKWFFKAFRVSRIFSEKELPDGTYEAIGKHFNGDPYRVGFDMLCRHGEARAHDVPKDFEGIKEYLKDFIGEGIVYWMAGEPVAKIKRSDFGYPWNAEVHRELCLKLVKSVKERE